MSADMTTYANVLIDWLSTYTPRVVGALALIFMTFWLGKKARLSLQKVMDRAKIDPTLSKFLSTIAYWSLVIAMGIMVLGLFGIQTTSFAAIIAASGIAIGLAFQGTLSNVAAGVMLLLFRPFKVGHVINAAGVMGTVDEIGLFSTTIDTPDNRRIIVPNSSIFGSTIENISHHSIRRVDIPIGVSYDADLETTRQVLENIVDELATDIQGRTHAVVLTALGASSVDWVVRVWVESEHYWAKREQLFSAIKTALDQKNIGIPYPQMDVHIHKDVLEAQIH